MKTCKTCNEESDNFRSGRSTCRPCAAKQQREYRASNLEAQRDATRRWRRNAVDHEKAYGEKYREENREARIEACRKWREENPGKQAESERRYRESNRGKVNAKNMKRHAAKLNRTVGWADLKAVDAIYEEARLLTEQTGVEHHVDHIIPLQGRLVSGLHVEGNLQILTASANCSKGNEYRVALTC